MTRIETPDEVENRVFHEQSIPPGSICRTYREDDEGGLEPTAWFAVASTPVTSENTGLEYIWIVWLEGDDEGSLDKYFLGDLGVQPPHRGVCEKHDLQIPERFMDDPSESMFSKFTRELGRA